MKKEVLIKALQKLPKGAEVCIYDWRKNLHNDTGDGSGVGVYPDFEIEISGMEDAMTDGIEPFAVMTIYNDDYDDNGMKL
jgi:hypothetical protein